MGFFSKLFDPSAGEIKRLNKIVDKIDSFEEAHKALTDEQLRGKTVEFRERLKNGETLDDLLPEAYSVVREATYRVTGKRQFRVQMLGGIVLHQGRIAEMKTGEGKTLTATMPAYLNALSGEGVHVVTVNDYLAKFQGEDVGRIFRFLGMTVGVIVHDLDAGRAQGGVCLRYHLRHEQRDGLRLSARQHGHLSEEHGAARPSLCHRGRSGLYPHRRGAHAADHLRRGRQVHRSV